MPGLIARARRARDWIRARLSGGRLETLAHLAAPIGLVLVAVQMYSDARDRRIARSLDLIGRLSAVESLAASNQRVNAFWASRPAMVAARAVGFQSPQDGWNFGTSEMQQGVKGDGDALYLAVYDIAAYLDELAVCIDRGVCDKGTAQAFLGQYARDFWSLHYSIIRDRAARLGPSTLGCGLAPVMDIEYDDVDAKRCAAFLS